MKKLIILFILLFALRADAWMNVGMVGGGVPSGCTKGATIFSESFEAIADGEEWSNDGNWVEAPASTDNFVGDDARKNGGSLSGLVDNAANGNTIGNVFAEKTTGYISFEFYLNIDANNVTLSNVFAVGDGTLAAGAIIRIGTDVSGNIEIYSNDTLVDMASIAADTWVKIEVQLNVDQGDGIGAIRVWIDGVEGANSPYDTVSRVDPDGVDRAGFLNDTSGDFWVDDVLIYAGQRCGT